jgi:23S rRNA pseudouridine1911/1915/1917 synthase
MEELQEGLEKEEGLDYLPNLVNIYEHRRFTVDEGQAPVRIDKWLVERTTRLSRSRIKRAAQLGFLRVNGKAVKVSYKVRPGDEIVLALPYPPTPQLTPEPIPLNVVYEDDALIVLDKPAGMVVHPGHGNYSGTLVNALLYYFNEHLGYRELSAKEQQQIRPGMVHRLDKGTSGLLVIAKDEEAYADLARQFSQRTTHRYYIALVWGNIEEDRGTIQGNIGRSPFDRKKFQVYSDGSSGKPAITHFRVLARFGVATLVVCKLETGRTHQIRVHFLHQRHPIFGDRFYGGHRILYGKPSNAYKRFINDCLATIPYQALHAKTLGFVHPRTGKTMFFDSPLPEAFQIVLKKFCAFFKVSISDRLNLFSNGYHQGDNPIVDYFRVELG